MTKELRTYLEWRFRVNNLNKYQRYRDEWIESLTDTQIQYLEVEMNRLIRNGKYH